MSDFSINLDVGGVSKWAARHFNEFVAANFRNEELDGKHLLLLVRSPDSIALLNRLGIHRIKDILRFQELLCVLRPNNTCYIDNKKQPAPVPSLPARRQSFVTQQSNNQATVRPTTVAADYNSIVLQPFSPPSMVTTTATTSVEMLASLQPQPLIFDPSDKALSNLQQKLIRKESRKRWQDDDLPTFRRWDTSNNEELNMFCEELAKMSALRGMGRELIRKKVISIVRERRKYISKMSQPSGENETAPSFVFLEVDEDADEHEPYQIKSEDHSESDHDFEEDTELDFSQGTAKKKPRID